MPLSPRYYLSEVQYRLIKTVRTVQGAGLQLGLRLGMGGGAAAVATKLSNPFREAIGLDSVSSVAVGTGEAIATAASGLGVAGAAVGVKAYMNQLEYKHEQNQLMELYRPQIASILGKERGAVELADLRTVAETNPSLESELSRFKARRNISNAASAIGTLGAFVAVFAAIALFPPLGAMAAAAATGGIFSGAGIGFAVASAAIGYGALQASKRIVGKIGGKLFGLDAPSVEDQVHEIGKQHRKEKTITQEQVLGVFVTAQPTLAADIETHYSKPYHKLTRAEKREAVQHLGPTFDLGEVTAAINEDRMNARELTFRVHGQQSGVYPERPLGERLKELAGEKLDPLQNKLEHIREDAVDKFQDWRETRRQSKLQDKVAEAIEEGRPLPDEALEQAPESRWRDMVRAQQIAAERGDKLPGRT